MRFQPLTAREALIEIRLQLAKPIPDGETRNRIERLCKVGLGLNGMENFTLSDRLADRLAEAHDILAALQAQNVGSISQGMDLRSKIAETLALPPDLEGMIERRKGRT